MSAPVTYDYEELEHDYEGVTVPCRDCGTPMFLKYVIEFGCHECDATARDVTVRAKDHSGLDTKAKVGDDE